MMKKAKRSDPGHGAMKKTKNGLQLGVRVVQVSREQ